MDTPAPRSTRTLTPLVLVFLLSMTGCFSLGRDAPPQQHYVLGGSDASAAARALATPSTQGAQELEGGHVIGIRSVQVADYLASPFIVVRRGAYEIGFSDYHRWGENLGRAMNRTVAAALAARAPAHRIEGAPWPSGTSPDVLVQVKVLRFEGVVARTSADGESGAHLLATWEVLGALDGAVLARGTTDVWSGGWVPDDFDGLVRLLDASLDTLAAELARGLEQVLTP
ncbi:MAG: membrane integrity-associated transporter subunit PqiC [Gemmatimonadales bacterium]|nr:MAG: membrane integrity-associated transporter subunit PqiC [Gemmatimonadales bacterium]